MSLRRTLSLTLMLALLASLHAQAQKTAKQGKSELQPNNVYECLIEKTLGGNTGEHPVETVTSIRRITLTTGADSPAGLAVEMTVSRNTTGGSGAVQTDWRGTFLLKRTGVITDMKQIEGEGVMNPKSMEGYIARNLAAVLFNPVYDFRMKPAMKISFPRKSTATSSGQAFVMTTDDHAAEEQGMVVDRTGTAEYNAAAKIYTSWTLQETSRIAVTPTATEEGREVIVSNSTSVKVSKKER